MQPNTRKTWYLPLSHIFLFTLNYFWPKSRIAWVELGQTWAEYQADRGGLAPALIKWEVKRKSHSESKYGNLEGKRLILDCLGISLKKIHLLPGIREFP
jgi:hypothetical protein